MKIRNAIADNLRKSAIETYKKSYYVLYVKKLSPLEWLN